MNRTEISKLLVDGTDLLEAAIGSGETESTLDVTIELESSRLYCTKCSSDIVYYAEEGWIHEDDSRKHCHRIEPDEADEDSDVATPPDPGPAEYVNWIGASVLEDSVEVQISVGESRGCLTMNVWQGEDEDGKPVVYVSVPHPDESAPHVKLVPHGIGTYVVRHIK